MNVGDLNKVWEIRALKRKPLEEEAKQFLEKIAKQVQPIIRNHNWRVKLLSEFCPNNPVLLGLNVGGGIHIKLRLRRPNRDLDFLPFDQVLDTMLHELCHNAHGPHNASFYKLWDELRKECEELILKGISGTGAGFDLPGRRVGGFSRQPSLSSLRQTALAAAEKRVKLGSILPSGPNRLGGDSTIMSALSPIQAAAMAAERRLQDEIWCGSHSSEIENVPDITDNNEYGDQVVGSSLLSNHRKRSHECNNDALSVSSSGDSGSKSVDICQTNSRSSVLSHRTSPKRKLCKAQDAGTSNPSSQKEGSSNPTFVEVISVDSSSAMWECRLCTFLNPPLAPLCRICSTEKPTDINTKHHLWSCKFCTLENSVTLDRCLACDQWRFSFGPPVSTKGPNLGT